MSNKALQLLPEKDLTYDIVSLGEVMLRLDRLIRLAGVGEQDWSCLESRISLLTEMLSALSVIGSTPKEDEISVLARALWKARLKYAAAHHAPANRVIDDQQDHRA